MADKAGGPSAPEDIWASRKGKMLWSRPFTPMKILQVT